MHNGTLVNARLVSCSSAAADNDYGYIENAAIACRLGKIVWTGRQDQLPERYSDLPQQDVDQRVVTPLLIDCHTHLVHAGQRAEEFELRLQGASYEQVARAGGGIVSTVAATRQASVDELIASALPRLQQLQAEGVGVVEIKSGYGLDIETELNMLRAARRLGELPNITVITSFLGAHALPPEFKDQPDTYLDTVCLPALQQAFDENLVDMVDGFCEGIAFTPAQIARVFDKARMLGLPVRLHAEQLSLLGGARLAASYGALCCDHLEYLDEYGVKAMADANSVAVLLPGAFYTLRETQAPPIHLLRQHKVPMAVATDSNPGSSPLTSLLLAMNMAATLFRLTPAEALLGVTRHAASALGIAEHFGTLEPGKNADLLVWDINHPRELAYRMGFRPDCQRL